MKESIDSILTIDKNTREIVEKTELEIENLKKGLREKLTDMENESIEKSKILGKEKEDEIDKVFKKKAELIRDENKKNLEKIEKFYNDKEEDLVKEALELVLEGKHNV
ncbi:hypothetical protein KQI68_02730 [Peptoniphilus sp. MSJ-1]|uniref:V-type ATP synthase subunit H n=1 Tax=Peptoniphilus ovalis TaxID=2841503 RepID=A0ABS6FF01_9FIRM|nr:hypothetical protein [Peptoniphilus ovalis]MBU5668750.1 hypothetical protein [Peptoniphilus ovalis]